MWTNANKILIGLLIVAVVCLLAYFAKRHSPNKDDIKLNEVRQLYSQLPIPPGFEEKGSSFQSKSELALVSKYFQSKTAYDDVKAFYVQRLIPTGWTLIKERQMTDWFRDFGGRELEFRKGEYSVVIDYSGERSKEQENYGVILLWNRGR